MSNKNYNIADLIDAVERVAKQKGDNAAYAGSMSDGGMSRLLEQVKFYRLGASGKMPEEWVRLCGHLLDDEWQEYERLREKFKGMG